MAGKYEGWTLKAVKDELRNRGAKLSGRKHELVERLEAYDRNQNFKDVILEPEHVMVLPDPGLYKDVNSDTKVTVVSFENSNDYLEQLDKSLSAKSNKLADARFLKYLRWCQAGQNVYFRGECKAEMKKSVSYLVDIQCDVNGKIVECQCECAAGMGPQAHCKHVCALLYILGKFRDEKIVLAETTCTEKLQTFHHVKRKTGSPVKAQNLQLHTNKDIRFDPRPLKYRKMPGYNDYVRGLCLNYRENTAITTFPLKQMYEPANVHALEHDHDYLSKPLSALFLDVIYKTNTDNIEEVTRNQSSSNVWLEERTVRLTASNFGRICKLTDRTDKRKLAESFTQVLKINTPAIKHGRKHENTAVKQYESLYHITVSPAGLFVDAARPYLGASPDGVVDADTLLEVKCPKTAYRKPITHVTVPYLKKDGDELTLSHSHDYYYQIQGQLAIADRQVCHLMVWTETDTKVICIQRNESFIRRMFEQLDQFYLTFFKDAVLNRYFYRNYHAYNFKL